MSPVQYAAAAAAVLLNGPYKIYTPVISFYNTPICKRKDSKCRN